MDNLRTVWCKTVIQVAITVKGLRLILTLPSRLVTAQGLPRMHLI